MEGDDQGALAPGAALLLIIGEPFSEEQKTLILGEITKGFRCWDVEDTGININEELAQIANRASLGEEGANASNKPGERLIQHQSDNLAVEILINPLAQTVKNSVKKLLIASSPTKYIIYAGHAFQGSGAWVLQDDTFAFSNLAQVFKNVDVENALKQNIEANLTIHTLADSNWGTSISKADFTNNLRIQLNPPEKLDNIHGVLQFTAYVGGFVRVVPITSLLQASEQFGNISFTRPTLYIFPGCQGDSALFGVNGFNLLVNGGYNRRACFWDFARHLDRVDAMLMTHLGTDNIFGLNTVLQRKTLENIHPQIGYLYFNALDKIPPAASEEEKKNPSLLINLAEEATKMTQMAKELGISPHPCTRSATATNLEPVNLYHKLGHGSLDMYILNPITDSKELKEFFQSWNKQAANLGTSGPFPLQNALSVCTLLVWKPYNFDEKIVRIFFPGNAPQHKVIEGLEKMKSFGFLKHASCTTRDLMKPPAVKKAPGGAPKPSSGAPTARGAARPATSSRGDSAKSMNSSRVDSPRKAPEPRTKPEPKATSPTKTVKKEENNKKNVKAKPKAEEKETKPKPAASKADDKDAKARPTSAKTTASSSQGKAPASPRKTPSPTKAASPTKASSPGKSPSPPKASSPPKSPTKAKSPDTAKPPPAAAAAPEPTPAVVADQTGDDAAPVNHVDQQELKPESDQTQVGQQDQVEALQTLDSAISAAPDAVPETEGTSVDSMSGSMSVAVDKQKLEELGIYEEQKPTQPNGDTFDAEEEEVKPQALPEPPVIVESPSQDSEGMPDYSSKIESYEQELDEFSRAEEELKELESKPTDSSFADPAQEIPPSPEPAHEEQHDYQYPTSVDPPSGFETPTFTNDGPDPVVSASQPSMEQNIQYGIDDLANGRDMGGIQEVDEEEHEEEAAKESDIKNENSAPDKEALREMGIYDDEDEEDDEKKDDDASGFEKDSNPDDEEIQRNVTTQQECLPGEHEGEQDEEEEAVRDLRTSAERQFEDVDDEGSAQQTQDAVDEGIEEDGNSSLPAAFDKDSSPEVDAESDKQEEPESEQRLGGSEDRDSIDGGTPDDDKDVDEAMTPKINGDVEKVKEIDPSLGQKSVEGAAMNPFIGIGGGDAGVAQKQAYDSDDELQGENFDPETQWGKPMGLPSPPPVEAKSPADAKKAASAPKANGAEKRPASARAPKPGTTSNDIKSARGARNGPAAAADAKKRPATAPGAAGRGTARPGTATRRPGTGSSRSSPLNTKTPPLPPMTPFYVDLTYIPNHGDPAYTDAEFFKRVRARYYVISSLSPNPQVLDSLMEAKATWDQKDLLVTLIPTYDNETLRHWMGLNKEKLQELRIDMTPAVSRCTIQLQDLETSLPAYRLEV